MIGNDDIGTPKSLIILKSFYKKKKSNTRVGRFHTFFVLKVQFVEVQKALLKNILLGSKAD